MRTSLFSHISPLYSASTWCTKDTAIEPSPTADATRFKFPPRISPTANTPGKLVSRRYGGRERGHLAFAKSSVVRSRPVLIKPAASHATQPPSHAEFGTAPVIEKRWAILRVPVCPVLLLRQVTRSR